MKKRWYLCIGYSNTYGFNPRKCEYDFDYCSAEEAVKYAHDLAKDFVIDQEIVTKESDMANWEYNELVCEECCIRVYEIEGEPERDKLKELGLLDFISEYCFDTI